MLSLEFWGAKKEPPEAQNKEFVLSLEFLAAKWAFWGSPGGEKEHFYHVFRQILQKSPKPGKPPKKSATGEQRKQRYAGFSAK